MNKNIIFSSFLQLFCIYYRIFQVLCHLFMKKAFSRCVKQKFVFVQLTMWGWHQKCITFSHSSYIYESEFCLFFFFFWISVWVSANVNVCIPQIKSLHVFMQTIFRIRLTFIILLITYCFLLPLWFLLLLCVS